MTNRREFLQIGIAATTLPLAAQAARAANLADASTDHVPLYKVLYDLRFPQSVAFAQRVTSRGVDVHAIEGDMTRFWYDDLHYRWQRAPAAIAGLTAHGPLFCLERLAWDHGMRVVFRAEHKFAGSACVAHELTGPIVMLHGTGPFDAHDWVEHMADLVTQCPSGRAEIARTFRSSAVPTTALLQDSLYSWVIAPASRA